jgi:hypothetical protein
MIRGARAISERATHSTLSGLNNPPFARQKGEDSPSIMSYVVATLAFCARGEWQTKAPSPYANGQSAGRGEDRRGLGHELRRSASY